MPRYTPRYNQYQAEGRRSVQLETDRPGIEANVHAAIISGVVCIAEVPCTLYLLVESSLNCSAASQAVIIIIIAFKRHCNRSIGI